MIVTTIQKLGLALDPEHKKELQGAIKTSQPKRLYLFLMNATVRSLEIIIEPLKNFFPMRSSLGLLAHQFLKPMQATSK